MLLSSGKNACSKCPSPVGNAVKIVALFSLLLIAFGILLVVNLRRKTESQTGVVLRIMANYFQIITSAAAFQLEWPKHLQVFFGMVSTVGESAESFISFDCFLKDSRFFGSFLYLIIT